MPGDLRRVHGPDLISWLTDSPDQRAIWAADFERGGDLPVVAIGGITLETAPAVLAAGASQVAVISDLLVGDPEARVRRYGSL